MNIGNSVDYSGMGITQYGQSANSSSESGDSDDELGQAEFLKLLSTQMQSQDPFKPMENSDFMGQMAQFSTVSGIQEMQASMEKLASSLTSNESLQAATLVGRTVLAEGEYGQLTAEGPMAGAVELGSSASNVKVTILSQGGQVLEQIDLGQQSRGLVHFEWEGVDSDGERYPEGSYRVVAESQTQGAEAVTETTLVSGLVDSVTLGSGGAVVNIGSLGAVDFAKVREIRR